MSPEQAALMLTMFVNYTLGQGFKVASVLLNILKVSDTVKWDFMVEARKL